MCKSCEQIPSLYLQDDDLQYTATEKQENETNQEDEEIAAEDEEDMGVIETYSNYMPSKLNVRDNLQP